MARHQCYRTVTFIQFLCILFSVCLFSHRANGEKRYSLSRFLDDEKTLREFEQFLEWKQWNQDHQVVPKKLISEDQLDIQDGSSEESVNLHLPIPDLPPPDHPALVGRYVVNQANWTAVATISRQKEIATFPFANVVAVSDGPLGNGSGIPYMYLTPFDFTGKDLKVDSRATLMMTLAQGSFCQAHGMEPIDPRCARILMSGKIKPIKPHSSEFNRAQNAVFGRHPALRNMPADHHFYFAKLKISFIAVLDTFGGAKFISVKDYFNPPELSQSLGLDKESDENSDEEMKIEREVYIV